MLINGDIDGIVSDYADDAVFITPFIEWSAKSAHASVSDGVDTLVFRDGLISVQTVRYSADPQREWSAYAAAVQ